MKITDEEEISQLILARLRRTGSGKERGQEMAGWRLRSMKHGTQVITLPSSPRTESLSRLGVYLRSRGVDPHLRLKRHLQCRPALFALEERCDLPIVRLPVEVKSLLSKF